MAPAPPAGGTSLAEYATTNTSVLTNSGGSTITTWDSYRGAKTPQYINWTFGLQRQLTHEMSLTISYVGSQGHFLAVSGAVGARNNKLPYALRALAGYNVSGTTATPCAGTACTAPLMGQKATAANLALASSLGFAAPNPYSGATYYASNSVYQYYQPFPQFSGLSDTTSYVGNTSYNALQLSLRQRTAHGLDFMLNYTYSKSIDDIAANGVRLPDNPKLDRSISTTDQPQNLTSTAVYKLPFGHGHIGGDNFWVNALGGGWSLSGIFSYHSGTPLSLSGSGCGGSGILNTCMPNAVAGVAARIPGKQYGENITASPTSPNYYAATTNQYINPAAFSVNSNATGPQAVNVGQGPELYVPGNASRIGAGNVWSMSAYNLDFGVKRSFPIWREAKLQFEADCFNATNHVIWGAVGGQVNGSGYGLVTSLSNSPRDWQFSGRINW